MQKADAFDQIAFVVFQFLVRLNFFDAIDALVIEEMFAGLEKWDHVMIESGEFVESNSR